MPKFLDVTDKAAARAALGIGLELPSSSVRNTGYTALENEIVLCDASNGGFTITLPDDPADGARVVVKKLDSTSNAVTVQRGGSSVFNQANGPSLIQLTVPGQTLSLQHGSGIWIVLSNSAPPSSLDDKYFRKDSIIPTLSGKVAVELENSGTAVVNWFKISASVSGQPVQVSAQGADTDIDLWLRPKGSGGVGVVNSAGANVAAFIGGTSPVNRWMFYAASTGNQCRAVATGTDTNVSMNLETKGTGVVKANNVEIVTISAQQTITSKTLTNPKINAILDTNGNTAAVISGASNAVNHLWLNNTASGTEPRLRSAGDDSNVGIGIQPKGTGGTTFYESGGSAIAGFTSSGLGMSDGKNILLGVTNGTKIGTATNHKLAFWNATPVVQPSAIANATDSSDAVTKLNSLLGTLRTLGLIAT